MSGLTAAPSITQERTLLTWSGPGGTYDSLRLSMKLATDTPWIQVYNGPTVSSRYVYPAPGDLWDFKLETVTAGVATLDSSTTSTLGWASDEWGVLLRDTVTTEQIPLGMFETYASLKQARKSLVKSYVPMGSRYPKDWKSRAQYQVFPAFNTYVPEVTVLADGTILQNRYEVIAKLLDVFPPAMSLLLYRDDSGFYTFVAIIPDPDISPVVGGGWDVNMVLEERLPPAGGYSTAT